VNETNKEEVARLCQAYLDLTKAYDADSNIAYQATMNWLGKIFHHQGLDEKKVGDILEKCSKLILDELKSAGIE
jgi:hypothetical protein